MDHMSISGTEPSSVILRQTPYDMMPKNVKISVTLRKQIYQKICSERVNLRHCLLLRNQGLGYPVYMAELHRCDLGYGDNINISKIDCSFSFSVYMLTSTVLALSTVREHTSLWYYLNKSPKGH